MGDNKIIYKIIDNRNSKLLGKGTALFQRPELEHILNMHQNEYNSVVLEVYDPKCTQRIGLITYEKDFKV